MSEVSVKVRWHGKPYDVELDTSGTGADLKAQMFSLTGVSPERQKIMIKGRQIKDDDKLFEFGMKAGQLLLMMGTAVETKPAEPMQVDAEKPGETEATEPKFMEDMTAHEVAEAHKIRAGLINLGNTCYMNATLQCLRAVPELVEAVQKDSGASSSGMADVQLGRELGNVFRMLQNDGAPVMPMGFVAALRRKFPSFGQIDNEHKSFQQQDADECWSGLLNALAGQGDSGRAVEAYMTGQQETTYTSCEEPLEPAQTKQEPFRKLDCRIDKAIGQIEQGIRLSLHHKVDKHSPSLARNATYDATTRLTRLPQYLTVTFVRFFWKPKESVGAKIMKKVRTPARLDALEFCAAPLQLKMQQPRQFVALADKAQSEVLKPARNRNHSSSSSSSVADAARVPADTAAELRTLHGQFATHQSSDPGANASGHYERVAVLTHVGRNAQSGHYIAWVRCDPQPTLAATPAARGPWWYKFDDDKVALVADAEIDGLDGGSDTHTAYIVLYRAVDPDALLAALPL